MSNVKQNQTQKIRRMVLLAVLTAIVLILQLAGNYLRIPFIMGTSPSLVLVPIAMGAVLLDPAAGAWLGFVFGAVVYIQCGVMGQDLFTAFLFQAHPVATAGICILKSTLAGLLAGFAYRILAKKNELVAVFVAAAIVPVVNTAIFLVGGMMILSTIRSFMEMYDLGDSAVYFLFFGCAGWNFIFEFLFNMIMAPVIERVIRVFRRRKRAV